MEEISNFLMIMGTATLVISIMLILIGFDYEFETEGTDLSFSINVILLSMTFFFYGTAIGMNFFHSETLGFIVGLTSFIFGWKLGRFTTKLIIKSENTDIIDTETFIGKTGRVIVVSNTVLKVEVEGKEFLATSSEKLTKLDEVIVSGINGSELILTKKENS